MDSLKRWVTLLGGLIVVLGLATLRGKVVVINFWASWCIPCREEAPVIEATWRRYKDRGVVVLGINVQDLSP